MTESKQNVTILLDRLYNLKGEDNVLIKETEERIQAVLNRISQIEETIVNSKAEQEEQEAGLTAFLQQKSLFETAFDGLTDETFSALNRIDVDLRMGSLMSQVQTKSPAFIKALMETIDGIKKDIVKYESEKDMANKELADLKAKLVVHNDQRSQLVSLLEQSLSNEEIERESLTASFVKRVLSSFEVFNVDEISKLTKMIMFPDEGLYEYDRGYEERVSKGLIGYVEDEEPIVETTFETQHEEEKKFDKEEISLEETAGIPSVMSKDGQIELDFNKIGTIDQDQELADEEKTLKKELQPSSDEVIEEIHEEIIEDVEEDVLEDVVEDVIENPEDDQEKQADNIEEQEDEQAINPPIVENDNNQDEIPEKVEMGTEEVEGPPVVLNFEQFVESDLDKAIAASPFDLTIDETNENEKKPTNDRLFDTTKVEAFLTRIGLDVKNFSKVNHESINVILREIADADEELVERNYEILRSINLDDEAYKMRQKHMYITDPDFSKKITLLRAKNISESKIQSMITTTMSGLRVPFADIEKRIQSVENLNGKVDDENIYLISKDVSKYEENLDNLLKYGIDLDEKEVRNYMAVLFENINIPANVEILRNYIISILKSNGKYALSVFYKKPEELLHDIDDLIEAGLENVIAAHPEVLAIKASSVLKRVKYCENHDKPVFTDEMRSEPCDYILKADKFRQAFDYPTDVPELVDRKHTNDILVDVIGNSDYIEILMNTLDDYYSNTESYATPEVVESMKERFEEFSHYLEDHAKAELVGKYTYKVDGVNICKTKMERNIAIILNTLAAAKQPTLGVEREIVLVSALYNSSLTEEELKKVAGSCLGFSQAAQEVKL